MSQGVLKTKRSLAYCYTSEYTVLGLYVPIFLSQIHLRLRHAHYSFFFFGFHLRNEMSGTLLPLLKSSSRARLSLAPILAPY